MLNLRDWEVYRMVTGKNFFATKRMPKLKGYTPISFFETEPEMQEKLMEDAEHLDFMVLELDMEGFKLKAFYSGKEQVPPIYLGPEDILRNSKKEFNYEEAKHLLQTYKGSYYSKRN